MNTLENVIAYYNKDEEKTRLDERFGRLNSSQRSAILRNICARK